MSIKTTDLLKSDFPLKYSIIALAAVCILNTSWLLLSRITVDVTSLTGDLIVVAALLLALIAFVSKGGFEEISPLTTSMIALIYGLIFLQIAWLNIRLFNHITMTTAFPYADSLLGGWEKQIGIDWIYYLSIVHDSAFLRTIMAYSYTGLTSVSFVLFIGVHLFIGRHRSFFFIEIFFFTAIIATGIGMFFPAMAAPAFYNISLTDYPNFEKIPGLYHLAHFDNLRKPTGEITLNPHILPGLVTFPSFHTAAGVLICFATFRSWLFAPTLLYSMTMIAATPVFGGHYFVDLLAGALIALVVSSWHVMSPRHRLAFSGPSRSPLGVQLSD